MAFGRMHMPGALYYFSWGAHSCIYHLADPENYESEITAQLFRLGIWRTMGFRMDQRFIICCELWSMIFGGTMTGTPELKWRSRSRPPEK
jgi:hypothetical protein